MHPFLFFCFFFFNDTATTEIYTLSLHDALPISIRVTREHIERALAHGAGGAEYGDADRSEEHTSELQSPCNLVCRLLLEKKKKEARKLILVIESAVIKQHRSDVMIMSRDLVLHA